MAKSKPSRLSPSGIAAISRAAKRKWRKFRAAKARGDHRAARRLHPIYRVAR